MTRLIIGSDSIVRGIEDIGPRRYEPTLEEVLRETIRHHLFHHDEIGVCEDGYYIRDGSGADSLTKAIIDSWGNVGPAAQRTGDDVL